MTRAGVNSRIVIRITKLELTPFLLKDMYGPQQPCYVAQQTRRWPTQSCYLGSYSHSDRKIQNYGLHIFRWNPYSIK